MRASSVRLSDNAILARMREITQRFLTVAATVSLALLAWGAASVAQVPAPRTDAPAPAAVPVPAANAGDAAAKHAKRTACLKDAKAKKLLGADKASFLKNCIGTP